MHTATIIGKIKKHFRAVSLYALMSIVLIVAFSLVYKFLLKSIYCKRYEAIVRETSLRYNIEPALIYAIIKGESGFDPNAKSSAGAMGLMQLTPDTFKWLQTYTKEGPIDVEMLFDPEVNVNYGTLFVSVLRERYDSDDLVLCAYNAGMSTVERWLRDANISNSVRELKFIPYKETREYVKRIKKNKNMYSALYLNDL